MTLPTLLFGLGLGFSPLYLCFTRLPVSVWRSGVKTQTLTFFALASVAANAPPFLTVALFLSALGDLALSRNGRAAFLYGLSAFALAHLCFVLLFRSIGGSLGAEAFAIHPGPAVAILLAALATELWLTPHAGPLRWPVRLYVALIAFMALTALTQPHGQIIAGAICFVVSDALLSLSLFRLSVDDKRQTPVAIALWVLYVAAAALIIWPFVTI